MYDMAYNEQRKEIKKIKIRKNAARGSIKMEKLKNGIPNENLNV